MDQYDLQQALYLAQKPNDVVQSQIGDLLEAFGKDQMMRGDSRTRCTTTGGSAIGHHDSNQMVATSTRDYKQVKKKWRPA